MTEERLTELLGDTKGITIHRDGAPSIHLSRAELLSPTRLREAFDRQRVPEDVAAAGPIAHWDEQQHEQIIRGIASVVG